MLFNKINSFRQILKIKIVKDLYSRRERSDIEDVIDKSFSNKIYGISVTRAYIMLNIPVIMIEYSLLNFVSMIVNKPLIKIMFESNFHIVLFLIIFCIPLFVLFYFTIYKENQYLSCFDSCEKKGYGKKFKYYLSVIFLYVMSFISLILSFKLLKY